MILVLLFAIVAVIVAFIFMVLVFLYSIGTFLAGAWSDCLDVDIDKTS